MSDMTLPQHGFTTTRLVVGHFHASNVAVPQLVGRMSKSATLRMQRAIIERFGFENFTLLVAGLKAHPAHRPLLVDSMRNSWWTLRNAAQYEDKQCVVDAVEEILTIDLALQIAGVPRDTLERMAACMSNGCVCEGCDLANGARLVGLDLSGDQGTRGSGERAAVQTGAARRRR